MDFPRRNLLEDHGANGNAFAFGRWKNHERGIHERQQAADRVRLRPAVSMLDIGALENPGASALQGRSRAKRSRLIFACAAVLALGVAGYVVWRWATAGTP